LSSSWLAKTNRGRIVYDRPIHRFTQKDIERILRLLSQGQDYSFLAEILHSLEDYMLGLILAPFGQADKAKLVRELLESFVGLLVKHLGGLFRIQIRLEVEGEKPVTFDIT